MAAVDSYSATGTKSAAKTSLDKAVFGVEVKDHSLIGYFYQAYLDNGRTNLAKTKTRGEVSGSTKKPWKQKGTGRARFGSRYNPIWRGGGITFGPRGNENYAKKTNLKAKKTAIRQALSLMAKEGNIKVIDKLSLDGKTSKAASLLKKLSINGKTLIVVDNKEESIERSLRNISSIKLVNANYLNVYDIVNADNLVITKKSLDILSEWLDPKPKATSKAGEK